MSMQKVLITGMSGLIGGAVRKQLEGKYQLAALNRRRIVEVECHQADISDLNAIIPIFRERDVVIHLAGILGGDRPWKDYLRYNVEGTYNVFEASRQAKVKRIIFASSGSTIAGWERFPPYNSMVEGHNSSIKQLTHESPIRPTGIYGCTKVWGEALARYYSDAYDLAVICLRIGAVYAEDRPINARDLSNWCSQRDVARMVEKCIQAPANVKFDIFYVVSGNKRRYRDIEHAREVVGFLPQDSADNYEIK